MQIARAVRSARGSRASSNAVAQKGSAVAQAVTSGLPLRGGAPADGSNETAADLAIRGAGGAKKAEPEVTLSSLIPGVVHKINNPIALIKACAQYCLTSEVTIKEAREHFQRILGCVQAITDFLVRLSRLAAPQEPASRPCSIEKQVRRACSFLGSRLRGRGIAVSLDIEANLPEILGDEELLGDVFLNLLRNAIEAIDRGGRITIRCRRDPGRDVVTCAIQDTGPGFPQGILKRAFDPSVGERGGGLGLGLPICRRIVESHGGTISLENSPGGGAIARLEFRIASRIGCRA